VPSEGPVAPLPFSLPGLAQLLGRFAEAGYQPVPFGAVDPGAAHLVLRHDVDFDLRCALRVARLEAELGVASTFFVMVRSSCYSILDPRNTAAVREIVALGHHIGLHLDTTAYDADDAHDLVDGARRELDILAWVAGADPEIISFHRPLPELVGSDGNGFGVPHTYEPRFTTDLHYSSDSQGRFRFGDPFSTAAFVERRALHLLLHPLWWSSDVVEGTEARLRGLVQDRHHAFATQVAASCLPYREMIA
jgi:hypothetical protein